MSATTGSRVPLVIAAVAVTAGIGWIILGGEPTPDAAPPAVDAEGSADASVPTPAPSTGIAPPTGDAPPAPAAPGPGDIAIPTELTLSMPPFPAEAVARWAAETPSTPSADQRELLDAWADIQEAEAGLQAGQAGDRAGAERRWLEALRTLALRDDVEAASQASHLAWAAFESGWDTLVAQAAADGTTVEALTRAGLPTALARQVGDSGVTLAELRLADPTGALRVDRDVLRAVFRWRWFTAMAPMAPTQQVMPADELRFVEAWRVVAGDHLDPDRRIRWINEYAAMWGSWQGLPAAFARAVVWADAGENTLASAALNEAVQAEPRLAPLRDRYQSP